MAVDEIFQVPSVQWDRPPIWKDLGSRPTKVESKRSTQSSAAQVFDSIPEDSESLPPQNKEDEDAISRDDRKIISILFIVLQLSLHPIPAPVKAKIPAKQTQRSHVCSTAQLGVKANLIGAETL
jgi:hypothetical protein